ncbi:hypothetical protein L1987_06891 [Smallanthus sonchifolius]|uniref:Uncharacterized protein n=1 Tax=Smallanthus sonchifolius TaxID=185202 RepID=A0ACB9JZL1_9ASTR|nr:hypothetical protein L1987_06891 [Smallanthus sonchifolius]
MANMVQVTNMFNYDNEIALQKRCEGSLDVKKSRKELLKKQFLVFKHFENESLDDLATRFYHLLSELSSASVVYETEEINDKFLEALPSKFDAYTVLIKENVKYKTMSLEEVLGKIQSHDLNMKKKETNMEHIQDPSMYFAKTSGKTGAGVAFFFGDVQDTSNDHCSGVPIHSSHSGFSATTASTSSGSHNMNQKVADDYLAMFSSFMASYENFIGGKIHDLEVIEEDFRQIDHVDLEEMNIQWNMAMLMRQAKDFLKKTGRKYIGSNSHSRLGFDKTKNDENYDWGIHLEDLVGTVSQAFVAEIHSEKSEELTDDESSSDGESVPSVDEEIEQVQHVDSDIASGVSEDDIVLTQNASDGADSENIPIAKVFMADMSNPSKIEKRNEIVAQKNKEISDKESEVIKLHQKLENFENSYVVLDYFNANADPTKRVIGIGFVPPPFNANYVVEPEIIHKEEIDPKTVLKVNPVTGEDMIYDSDSEDEVFDDKKVEGIPKEVQLDDPKIVKNVTRDRCILTEPDEVQVEQPKLSKMLQSSGFVAAGYQKPLSSKVPTQIYVQKKPVNCSVTSSEAYSSESSSNSRKPPYVRNHHDRRVCFHCNEAGHILIHCPYKNQGKLKTAPSKQKVVKILKRTNEGKSTFSVEKNMPCQSFAKSSGFRQHDKLSSKSFVCQEKFEIPHVGIPKDSQPEVKLSRPQRRRRNRKLKKLLETSESDKHISNNVFPINHNVSSLKNSNCESFVPKVNDNIDCELLEGQPRRTINNTWYVDSGCSRHMTGNIRLLEDVKNIDGGYVAFAGNKGGYITGQGTLKNDKVKFEKVNYVEQLEHNLLSVSQVCDKKFSFHFNDSECYILKPGFVIPDEWILMKAPRRNDTYVLDMSVATTTDSIPTCLLSKASESDSILWHRKLAHINYRKMNYLVKNYLVLGIPKMKLYVPDDCIPCKKGKQRKKSDKSKSKNSIVTPLELLHMDLFGPISIRSNGGKSYCFVVTDDFSRFSWVKFLASKAETTKLVQFLILALENLFNLKVRRIRSDNGREFKNSKMGLFCLQNGIHHEFSAPYVPQQNGVAERKNRTLVETARIMLANSKLPVTFWAEAVNIVCHVLNRVLTVKRHNKTCYELQNTRKPNLEYLLPFGNPCTMLKVRDVPTKFSAKAIEGIFLGYVANSTTKRVYNKETR